MLSPPRHENEHGVALLLVVFVIALASILVINLTYSTYLGAQMNTNVQRSLKAEYLLKSALSFAEVLLQKDVSEEDARQDIWGAFVDTAEVPVQLLGINEPNVKVQLEIRPEDVKIPLNQIEHGTINPNVPSWRDILARLFRDLGFDDDNEVDQTHNLNRSVNAKEMVAALIDYVDADDKPYDEPGFAKGVELKSFPNKRLSRVDELAGIPGFTPRRLRLLEPFVTAANVPYININLASRRILKAIDENLDDKELEAIEGFRNDTQNGPFTPANMVQTLQEMLSDADLKMLQPRLSAKSGYFHVIAKVDFGTAAYFLRAYVAETGVGQPLLIKSVELFN